MLCAIVAGTFLYSSKISSKDNDMDRLAEGLSGIELQLKPGSRILIVNKTPRIDLSFRARYLLVPHIVNMNGDGDTILSISEKSNTTPDDTSGRILWSNSDSLYHYTITYTR